MSKKTEVYNCGTPVHFNTIGVHATITAFLVRFDRVEYELTYAIEQERKTVWVHETEFTTENTQKQAIGFKK